MDSYSSSDSFDDSVSDLDLPMGVTCISSEEDFEGSKEDVHVSLVTKELLETSHASVQACKLSLLGTIYAIVGDTVIITPAPNCPHLNICTLVYLEDGAFAGLLLDIFGPIENPMYSAILQEDKRSTARIDQQLFYVPELSDYILDINTLVSSDHHSGSSSETDDDQNRNEGGSFSN